MPTTIKDVTKNQHNFIVMRELMRILSTFGNQPIQLENSFQYFSYEGPTSVAKCGTLYLQAKHSNSKFLFDTRPNLVENYIFLDVKDEKITNTYACSNNMTFREDIIIICYLNHMLCRRSPHAKCEIIRTLIDVMKDKYDISIVTFCRLNLNPVYLEAKDLTMFKISIFFPYTSLTISYHIDSSATTLLPSLELPKIIFAPIISLALPKSVENPPIAILMAICVKSEYLLKSQTSQTPLIRIYERILTCYNCDILPDSLKLDLCIKFKIVIKQGERFKFISRLTKHYPAAKDLISELRPNDPDLKDIFSKI